MFQCGLSRDENGGIVSYICTTHPQATLESYGYVESTVGSVVVSENEGEKVREKLESVGEVGEDEGSKCEV